MMKSNHIRNECFLSRRYLCGDEKTWCILFPELFSSSIHSVLNKKSTKKKKNEECFPPSLLFLNRMHQTPTCCHAPKAWRLKMLFPFFSSFQSSINKTLEQHVCVRERERERESVCACEKGGHALSEWAGRVILNMRISELKERKISSKNFRK